MSLTIRPRTAGDVPRLVEVLRVQQPASRYPFRWPLPFPPEEFVVRPGEEAAFAAVLDGGTGGGTGGEVVGQVAVAEVPEDDFADAWTHATGLDRSGLAMVSSFFVLPDLRGRGVGRALLDAAVGWIREHGRLPVLDVVPAHQAAVRLYERSGWRTIGQGRPPWLPDDEPAVLLMVLDDPA
ncbi:N-acetyltransferase [Nocardioides sp. CFH 31398]|uniref:GNAT family N-acetyltransferase n=1 Tax=Nocardioides sp. CFH 31398 TaxID=2919579 RepID=UPI001F05DEF7|nr:N-acetyltransferase [Nocardioides sp. CFH 31398]MCH1865253.1 GNAT family N-acetyltransferase [Nocardioides sp. CFH 31398]